MSKPMTRYKDIEWDLSGPSLTTWEQAALALLMDIRDELKKLNVILYCNDFQSIPRWLRNINTNTRKKRGALKRRT